MKEVWLFIEASGYKYLVFPMIMEMFVLVAEAFAVRRRLFLSFSYRFVLLSIKRVLLFTLVVMLGLLLDVISPLTIEAVVLPLEVVYVAFMGATLIRAVYFLFIPMRLEVLIDVVNPRSAKRDVQAWMSVVRKAIPFVRKYRSALGEIERVNSLVRKQSFFSSSLMDRLSSRILLSSLSIFEEHDVKSAVREEVELLRLRCKKGSEIKVWLLNLDEIEKSLIETYEEVLAMFEGREYPKVEGAIKEYYMLRVWGILESCIVDYRGFLLQALIKNTIFEE